MSNESAQGPTTVAPGATDTTAPGASAPVETAPPESLISPPATAQPGVTQPVPQLVDDGGSESGPPVALLIGVAFFGLVIVAVLVFMLVGSQRDVDPATRRRQIRTVVAVGLVLVLLAGIALVAAG